MGRHAWEQALLTKERGCRLLPPCRVCVFLVRVGFGGWTDPCWVGTPVLLDQITATTASLCLSGSSFCWPPSEGRGLWRSCFQSLL